jgi:hypothetical protein
MFRRPAVVISVIAVTALFGCQDHSQFAGPAPQFELSHSGTSGNPYFHILSPVGSDAGMFGTFNDMLDPVVEICRLSESDVSGVYPSAGCASEASPLIVATTGAGVTLENGYYQFQFKTSDYPALQVGTTYRIHVRIGKVLGYADVQPAANPEQVKLVPAGIHGFQIGSNVPFKFRIDEGAFCWPETSCSEYTIDPEVGGELDNGSLFVIALPGFVDPDGGTRTFELVRVTDLPCLPTAFRQYEACMEVRMNPALAPGEEFNFVDMLAQQGETVFIAMCLDPAANRDHVRKFKAPDRPWTAATSYDPLGPADPANPILPSAACADFAASQPGGHRYGQWLATRLLSRTYAQYARGLTGFVFGTPAHAGDVALFNSVRSLTRFGWIREIRLATAAQSASAGASTALHARVVSVHVEEDHHHADPADLGVNGVNVSFACVNVADPGYASCSHASGAAMAVSAGTGHGTGTATAQWTFTQPGRYRMQVTTPLDGADPADFDVVVTTWTATFLMPLSKDDSAPLPTQNITASGGVRICGPFGCRASLIPFSPVNLSSDGSYQVQWTIGEGLSVADGQTISVAVMLNGTIQIGNVTFVVAGEPRFNIGRTLPIKFRIER